MLSWQSLVIATSKYEEIKKNFVWITHQTSEQVIKDVIEVSKNTAR